MSTVPPPSDWPLQLDDDENTARWSRPTFMELPLPPLPADQAIEGLLGSRSSTVRKRFPPAATTAATEPAIPSIAHSTGCSSPLLPPANDVASVSRRTA